MKAALQTQAQSQTPPSFTPVHAGLLQRKCACGGSPGVAGECEGCSEQRLSLQRKAQNSELDNRNSAGVPSMVHEVMRSSGQPLEAETRNLFEPRFGHDFGRVRVHTGEQAAESASAVNALAYTVGHDIVFGQGQYAPGSAPGQRLLAHELTHVVQQRDNHQFASQTAVSSPDSQSEREADVAAESISTGQPINSLSMTPWMISRQAGGGGGGGAPANLAGLTATRVAFNNTGAPDAANCAARQPGALGVDGPADGQNGMEMIFRINGAYPAGTEFEITRTKATGLWQQDAGAWTRLGGWPAGSSDDHHDDDECQTPVAGRIFVVDTPGPPGTLDPTTVAFPNAGPVAATATALVWKLSFAEWVIARNRPLGIGWTSISSPLFHRWHSIFSVELVGGTWTRVNAPGGDANEIELGSIATAGATP